MQKKEDEWHSARARARYRQRDNGLRTNSAERNVYSVNYAHSLVFGTTAWRTRVCHVCDRLPPSRGERRACNAKYWIRRESRTRSREWVLSDENSFAFADRTPIDSSLSSGVRGRASRTAMAEQLRGLQQYLPGIEARPRETADLILNLAPAKWITAVLFQMAAKRARTASSRDSAIRAAPGREGGGEKIARPTKYNVPSALIPRALATFVLVSYIRDTRSIFRISRRFREILSFSSRWKLDRKSSSAVFNFRYVLDINESRERHFRSLHSTMSLPNFSGREGKCRIRRSSREVKKLKRERGRLSSTGDANDR